MVAFSHNQPLDFHVSLILFKLICAQAKGRVVKNTSAGKKMKKKRFPRKSRNRLSLFGREDVVMREDSTQNSITHSARRIYE